MDMNVALKINAGVTGQQAVEQLRTSMDKLQNAAAGVGKGFDLARTAVGAFAILQVGQAVLNFANNTINAADALNDMSERSGIAAGMLSELEYAAKLNGSSLEAMEAALTKVATKATDAATGNKTAAVAFDALGVSVKNADGSMRTSLAITEDIGEALRGISDPTLKSALAVEIFGKSGAKLIPVLENMKASREEARELGAVVGDDFVKAAAEFNDNMDRMGFMAKGFAGTILSDVLPALSEMFREMNTGLKVFGSFGSAMWNIGTTNPFKTPAEQAEAYTREVADLTAEIKALDATGNWYDRRNANRMRGELETAQKLAQYFREIAGIKEVGGGRGFINPPNVTPDRPDSAAVLKRLAGAKAQEEADKAAANAAKERADVLKGLSDEVVKLAAGEEALVILKLRGLGASDAEIARAEALMRQSKGLTDAEKLRAEQLKASTKASEDFKRAQDDVAAAGKRVFEDNRTPLEAYNAEMERLNDLLEANAISFETFQRASKKADDELNSLGKKGKTTMDELKDAVDGFGRQATDAFVEFAFTGKMSFSDLVSSILKDIARMVFQTLVMAPLMAAIKAMLPTAAFADGGIMTGAGPAPLKKYAAGGIANSPQLALFGEGSMPEAYVPLPDGRTIPVTMKGAGGGEINNVTVNVSVESGQTDQTATASGAAQLGKAIASAVRVELMNQKRPGGLLAA